MSLKIKITFSLTLLLLGLFTILTLFYVVFILNNYKNIEKNMVEQDGRRIRDALLVQFNTIQSKTVDWSHWDDAYQFTEDGNQEFITSNLSDYALGLIKMDAVVFVKNDGTAVYEKWIDPELNLHTRPSSVTQYLMPHSYFFEHTNLNDNKTGIVSLPEGILILNSNPITTSEGLGPSPGVLFFGRFLDSEITSFISGVTQLKLQFIENADISKYPDLQSSIKDLAVPNSSVIKSTDLKTVYGYFSIPDIYGNPAFYIRLEEPRTVYNEALSGLKTLLFAGTLSTIIFIFLAVLLFDQMFLKRLLRLSNTVQTLGEMGNVTHKIAEDNIHDELSNLTAKINEMLENIDKSTGSLREKSEILEEKTKALLSLNEMMVGREIRMSDMKKQIAHLEEEIKKLKST